jgi:hypothetical protein
MNGKMVKESSAAIMTRQDSGNELSFVIAGTEAEAGVAFPVTGEFLGFVRIAQP